MSARHEFGQHSHLDRISSSDLEAAARIIRSVSQIVEGAQPTKVSHPDTTVLGLAKKLKGIRAIRNQAYPADLFGEPAWDMLLALYIGRCEQYRMKITALTMESHVPPTTALRWIDTLIERNYARKVPNPRDARSTFVEMTDEAFDQMTDTLKAILSRETWR
ncbi:hypothetical protein [Sphingomonas xanthus]|uniref:MarR family transcriptional regulator n=1 Tax=Sphingomonas xanthus TaxID=2594473 RepID=A0A516IUB0_9SPHN|nr:hypothetical protein [Sphingomonas xanthus]QDP20424.1 hypothetical protein FMM02_10945 [Sphingomonas xanthus]